MRKIEIIAIVFCVVIGAIMLIMPIVTALDTGYEFSAPIIITNDTGSNYNGRVIIYTYPKSLVDGGFIYQTDGDDIYSFGADITALGLSNSGTQPWLFYPGTITAGNYETILYTGSKNAVRDQVWIAAGSDSFTVPDHTDLDLTSEFLLQATIILFTSPGSETWEIIDKTPNTGTPTGYQLIIVGSPSLQVEFNVYGSGTQASTSISLDLNTETNISAWYDGDEIVLTDGTQTDTDNISGSLSTNNEDLQICELAGECDNIFVRLP